MKTHTRIISLLFSALMIFIISHGARGQWNTDVSINLQISGQNDADQQTVPTSDGKTWIAFYSQNGGNYDMRAQLIDANGYKLLGPNGILVSNQTSGSAIYVFNVCADNSNNLIIACQDMRSGSLQAVLYKISETGTQLWGSTGIVLGDGLSPYPAVLSTGEVIVAWNESSSNTLNLQKITTSGTLAWSTPIQVLVGSTGTTRGQVAGNLGGTFSMVFQKKGVGVSTTLYAERFDNSGTSLYAPVQICNQTTSAARYYSVLASGDTTYTGYYASQGSRFNSFLQRINPDGAIPYGINGSNFNTFTGSSDPYQMQTDINLTAGSGYVWAVCNFSNTAQSQYGVFVQKFLRTTGARQLTDNAKQVYAISTSADEHAGALALVNDNPMFMSYDASYIIYATRLDGSGNFVWTGNRVVISATTASAGSPKMRYGFTPVGPNRCAGIWTEDRGSGYLGYAQGISVTGIIGLHVATQNNVPPVITINGGTLQMVDTIFPTTFSQSVTWSIIQGTGNATISTTGLVTALADGTVWAKAVAAADNTMKDSLMITISGQSPLPPTVTTLPATNVNLTTATLNGTVNANNYSSTVTFQWGQTIAYGNTVNATPSTVTGNTPTSVSANLTGLTSYVTYHFRCVATNANGTTYGLDQTFYTDCPTVGGAGAIIGPDSVCINATGQVYSINAVANATGYVWTVPSDATITGGQNTVSITVNFGSMSGTVSVYGTNGCDNGPPSDLPVTVSPLIPTVTGPTEVCANGSDYSYSTETGMNNYNWSVSSGGTITGGQGTNAVTVQWTQTGAQWLTVNYSSPEGCSTQNPPQYDVTVDPIPGDAGMITGDQELCAGTQGVVYSTTTIADAITYVWTVPAGATIVSGTGTTSITVDYSFSATSGDVSVMGNNLCGNGNPSSLPVTVNPVPPAPVVTLNGMVLTSSAPDGNQWYFEGTAIPGATGQTYTATQEGWYWTAVTLNGCTSDTSNHVQVVIIGLENHNGVSLQVYPVPNGGLFRIALTTDKPEKLSLRVVDQQGSVVYEVKDLTINGSLEREIDLRPVAPGAYSVELQNRDFRVVRKILIR